METLDIINLVLFGLNAGFALKQSNWHSLAGWAVACLLTIGAIAS